MTRIAVDVVLLPSEEVMDQVIQVNRELLKQYPDRIILNRENCLPHISLAMGCIELDKIHNIGGILGTIAKENPLGNLSIVGLSVQTTFNGEKVTVAEIGRTKELRELHENVMTKLQQYFSYDVGPDMFASDDKISDSTLLWVENYPLKSSYSHFSPHITLGYGELDDTFLNSNQNLSFPMEFKVTQLILCQLGNHCICRKVLMSIGFKL